MSGGVRGVELGGRGFNFRVMEVFQNWVVMIIVQHHEYTKKKPH